MKKLFLLAAFMFMLWMPTKALAVSDVIWSSSNTAVNISTTVLCVPFIYYVNGSTFTEGGHGVLHGVCINTAAAGNIQVWNSSGTAVNSVTGVLSTGTQQPCNYYDVGISSGMTYNKNGLADTSILYSCY